MLGKWFLFILFLLCSLMTQAREPLRFEGIHGEDIRELEKALPILKTSQFTLADIDKAIRRLAELKKYSFIQALKQTAGSSKEDIFILKGQLVSEIDEIRITGGKLFDENRIREILSLTEKKGLKSDQIEESLDRLVSAYENLGYINAKFEVQIVEAEKKTTLLIHIEEGPPCIISNVTIRTENATLKQKIRNLIGDFEGKRLTEDLVTDMKTQILMLFREEHYLNAHLGEVTYDFNANRSEAKVIFSIQDPERFEFFFTGNTSVETLDLLRSFDFEAITGTSNNPGLELETAVREHYRQKGFTNVTVRSKIKSYPQSYLRRIFFSINEGAKVRLSRILIDSRNHGDTSFYIKEIREHSSSLIRAGYYNREQLQKGADAVIELLRNKGYLSASLSSLTLDWTNNRDAVSATIHIDEGPQSFIQAIDFVGNKSFDSHKLRELLDLDNNEALDLEKLEGGVRALKDFYRKNGFLELRIKNEDSSLVVFNEDRTLARLTFDIVEGPQVVVKTILIEGNTFTKDYVVLNELDFQPGDILTPERFDISMFRLQKLGLFSKVEITMPEQNTPVKERVIVVQVADRNPGLFYLGTGLNNENRLTYRGYIGHAYRNIGGTARAISTRIDLRYSTLAKISYLEKTVTASYLEPYLLGRRTRGRFTLQRNEDVIQLDPKVMIQQSLEARAVLEYDFWKNSKFAWTLYSFSNLTTFSRWPPSDSKTLNIASIGPLVEFDLRNDIVNPDKGHYTRLELEYADPNLGSTKDAGRLIHFIRSTGNFTHYQPITKKGVTWVNTFRGGYLSNVSREGNSGVPAVKAFFLGSQNTIRGFNPADKEFIPNPLHDLGVNELPDFYVKGHSEFYLIKTEMRFPIKGSLYGQIFYDGGGVLVSGYKFNDSYRDAVGTGIRFLTPVGAVTLDIGFKLDRNRARGESPFALHFSIGNF